MPLSPPFIVLVDNEKARLVNKNFGEPGLPENVPEIRCIYYTGRAQLATHIHGTLSFEFNGTNVEVHGATSLPHNRGASNAYSCTIDGVDASILPKPSLGMQKDTTLCGAFNLSSNEPHTLEIELLNEVDKVWVDYVLYETSYDNLRENDELYYHLGRADALKFSTGWTETVNSTWRTVQDNSSIIFQYYGTEANMFVVGQPFNSTESGGQEGSVVTKSNRTGETLSSAQALSYSGNAHQSCPFFNLYGGGSEVSTNLTVGDRSWLVTYYGSKNESENLPLEISFFTVPFRTEAGQPGSSTIRPSKSLNGRAIAGITIGASVFVAILALSILLWYRIRRRQDLHQINPFYTLPGENRPRRHQKSDHYPSDPNAFGNGRTTELGVATVGNVWGWVRKQVQGVIATNRPEPDTPQEGNNTQAPVPMRVVHASDSGIRMAGPSTVVMMPPIYTRY